MNKKRILLIAQHGLNKGGIQTVLMSIVRALSEKFVFDIVIFSNDKRYYEDEFLSYGGNIYRIPHRTSSEGIRGRIQIYYRWIYEYFLIRKIIQCNGPYIAIHCNNEFESCVALRAAQKENIPVRIAHAHVLRGRSTRMVRRIFDIFQQKTMLRYATDLVGCSDKACETLFSPFSSYKIIPNSYDDAKFDLNKYSLVEPDEMSLIQVGNFSSLKNQIFTLDVFSYIVQDYPQAILRLIGFDVDGYKKRIEEKILQNELSNNVIIYPSDANIPSLMAKSMYFMLPSRTEAFGIVLLEAQAMGLRCFVSDVVPHISNVGGCIYHSIENDPRIWANSITEDYYRTKGLHQKYNCSKFKNNEIAKKYVDIYCGKETL